MAGLSRAEESSVDNARSSFKRGIGILAVLAAAIGLVVGAIPDQSGADGQQANLDLIRSSSVRNTNHDNSPYRDIAQADLQIEDHFGPRSDYLGNPGGNSEQSFPVGGGGQFRVSCEFSHFAYDDPLVHPNLPGAAHLHMFFGNTDVNAYSTYESLINQGSSTCNGQEVNRTGYWAPALFDNQGNVRIPMRINVYYKGYGLARGASQLFPPGAAMISEDIANIPNTAGGLAPAGSDVSFTCTDAYRSLPRIGANGAIPVCGDTNQYGNRTVLEHHVKFQNCLYGDDPSNLDNWRPAITGSWFYSHCGDGQTFPNIEYIIQYELQPGESTEGWYLSSDVDPESFTVGASGSSTHGDWWGGWHPEVNRMWLENCTNYRTNAPSGCGHGYLTDGGPNPSNPYPGPALQFRPQYNGPSLVPAATLFSELCPTNRSLNRPVEATFCTPGRSNGANPTTTQSPTTAPPTSQLTSTSGPQPTLVPPTTAPGTGPGSTVQVMATGAVGGEKLELVINDEMVATWELDESVNFHSAPVYQTYTHTSSGDLSGADIRVRFINDAYLPGRDRNVRVDAIVVDGTRYESEDPSVESSGLFRGGTCNTGRFGNEILHCNGYFLYKVDGSSGPQPTLVPPTTVPGTAPTTVPGTAPTTGPQPTLVPPSTTQPPTTRPSTTQPPTTQPPTTQPPTTRPPGGGDFESMRNRDSNFTRYADVPSDQLSVQALTDAASRPDNGAHPAGNFRMACLYSHFAEDDPIIRPGQPGASHLHMFFGNTEVDAYTTTDSLVNSGGGSCQGFELNRSGYWTPAVLDGRGNAVVPDTIIVYYKTKDPSTTQAMPQGLKIVAGNTTSESFTASHQLGWSCGSSGFAYNISNRIPSCGNDMINAYIAFPSCWDGTNLDSADHRSHMAYVSDHQSCPASHPVRLPQITVLLYFAPADTSSWYLSSDRTGGFNSGPGATLHADWWGGWNNETMDLWTNGCIRASRNCSNGQTGTSRQLARLNRLNRFEGPKYIPLP